MPVNFNIATARGTLEYRLVPWSAAGPGPESKGAVTTQPLVVEPTETARASGTLSYSLKVDLPTDKLNVSSMTLFERTSPEASWVAGSKVLNAANNYTCPFVVMRGSSRQFVRAVATMREGFSLNSGDGTELEVPVPGVLPLAPGFAVGTDGTDYTVALTHEDLTDPFLHYAVSWTDADGAAGSAQATGPTFRIPLAKSYNAASGTEDRLPVQIATVSKLGTGPAVSLVLTQKTLSTFEVLPTQDGNTVTIRAVPPTVEGLQLAATPILEQFVSGAWVAGPTFSYDADTHVLSGPDLHVATKYRVRFAASNGLSPQAEMQDLPGVPFAPLVSVAYDYPNSAWKFAVDPAPDSPAPTYFSIWSRAVGAADWGSDRDIPKAASGSTYISVASAAAAAVEYRIVAGNLSGESTPTHSTAEVASARDAVTAATFNSANGTVGVDPASVTDPVAYPGAALYPEAYVQFGALDSGGLGTMYLYGKDGDTNKVLSQIDVKAGTDSQNYTVFTEYPYAKVKAVAHDGSAIIATWDKGVPTGMQPPLTLFQRSDWQAGWGSVPSEPRTDISVGDTEYAFTATPTDSTGVLLWSLYTRTAGSSDPWVLEEPIAV